MHTASAAFAGIRRFSCCAPTFILRFSLLRPPKILSTRITISCGTVQAQLPHMFRQSPAG